MCPLCVVATEPVGWKVRVHLTTAESASMRSQIQNMFVLVALFSAKLHTRECEQCRQLYRQWTLWYFTQITEYFITE